MSQLLLLQKHFNYPRPTPSFTYLTRLTLPNNDVIIQSTIEILLVIKIKLFFSDLSRITYGIFSQTFRVLDLLIVTGRKKKLLNF